jgi:hypothetical protein
MLSASVGRLSGSDASRFMQNLLDGSARYWTGSIDLWTAGFPVLTVMETPARRCRQFRARRGFCCRPTARASGRRGATSRLQLKERLGPRAGAAITKERRGPRGES